MWKKVAVTVIIVAIIAVILFAFVFPLLSLRSERVAMIKSFSLSEQVAPAKIDSVKHLVIIQVRPETDAASLRPIITLVDGAKVNPASGSVVDFTKNKPVPIKIDSNKLIVYSKTFVVTGKNGKVVLWDVKVQRNESAKNEIEDLWFYAGSDVAQVNKLGVLLSSTDSSILIEVPSGTNITNLIPAGKVSRYAKAPVLDKAEPLDFSNSVEIEVIAEDGNKKTWTIQAVSAEPKAVASSALVRAINLETDTIRSGDGPENCFIRQLMTMKERFTADLKITKSKWAGEKGFERWANNKAHRIALENGYVKRNGEVRTYFVGTVYHIDPLPAGGFKVIEYASAEDAKTGKQSDVTVPGSTFDGPEHLQDYEYIHTLPAKNIAVIPEVYHLERPTSVPSLNKKQMDGPEEVIDISGNQGEPVDSSDEALNSEIDPGDYEPINQDRDMERENEDSDISLKTIPSPPLFPGL